MQRLSLIAAGFVVAAFLTLYLADYAWLRIRLARSANVYDTVQVEVVEQIPQKGNKAEYVPQDPQTQTCVRSLFPHLDDQPCWYLRRHTFQQVNY